MCIFLGKMKTVYEFYRHYISSKQCLRWCFICQATKACLHSPVCSEEPWKDRYRSTSLRCPICFISCVNLAYTFSCLSTEKQDDPRNPSMVTLSFIYVLHVFMGKNVGSEWLGKGKHECVMMFEVKKKDLCCEITSWKKAVSRWNSVVGKS